jgi:hypothetical protein
MERVEQMCCNTSVILVYLPLYSLDLNPIEEFFAELKAFIKKHWQIYEDHPGQWFDTFLEWCIDVVKSNKCSARKHFKHAELVRDRELYHVVRSKGNKGFSTVSCKIAFTFSEIRKFHCATFEVTLRLYTIWPSQVKCHVRTFYQSCDPIVPSRVGTICRGCE